MQKKRVLLITLSGGSGHLTAARAIRNELEKSEDPYEVIQKDVSYDWLGQLAGRFFMGVWHFSQVRGLIFLQELLNRSLPFTDFFFTPSIFLHTLRLLFRYDFDRIIDDQVLGTKAIINAVRLYNKIRKKDLVVEKVLTDLPTEYTSDFLPTIKRLNAKERPFIRLLTQEPLVHGESVESFWKRKTSLSIEQIEITKPPLRNAFYETKIESNTPLLLRVELHDLDSKERLLRSTFFCNTPPKFSETEALISIDKEDLVFTMMLGSHPSQCAITHYLREFYLLMEKVEKRLNKIPTTHLFILYQPGKRHELNLSDELVSFILNQHHVPKQFHVYPLTKQSDTIVASLFARSQATITRASGLTSMELLAVSPKEIWIHQEPPSRFFGIGHHGMVTWEYGNALYLIKKRGARLIQPKKVQEALLPHFDPHLALIEKSNKPAIPSFEETCWLAEESL